MDGPAGSKDLDVAILPVINGRAEKMNDILASYLRKARAISDANKTDFIQYLGPLALHYNTTVCATTRVSPHDALYGYSAKLPLWQKFEDIFPTLLSDRNVQDFLTEHMQRHLATRRIAYSNRLQQQDAMQCQQGSYDDVQFPMYQPSSYATCAVVSIPTPSSTKSGSQVTSSLGSGLPRSRSVKPPTCANTA